MWSTEDELKFIRHMGCNCYGFCHTPRGRLLALYAQAIERRTEWGHIDPERVRAYLATQRVPTNVALDELTEGRLH